MIKEIVSLELETDGAIMDINSEEVTIHVPIDWEEIESAIKNLKKDIEENFYYFAFVLGKNQLSYFFLPLTRINWRTTDIGFEVLSLSCLPVSDEKERLLNLERNTSRVLWVMRGLILKCKEDIEEIKNIGLAYLMLNENETYTFLHKGAQILFRRGF